MLITTTKAHLPIGTGSVARLHHARNTRLSVRSGEAWITVDADPRDIILAAGESFVLDSDEAVVVYPLRAGGLLELEIEAGPASMKPAAGGPSLSKRLADWLRPARHTLLAVS